MTFMTFLLTFIAGLSAGSATLLCHFTLESYRVLVASDTCSSFIKFKENRAIL